MGFGILMLSEEPVIRARFLMSPFNVREARRVRRRHHVITAFVIVILCFACVLLGIDKCSNEIGKKNHRVGQGTSEAKG